MLEDGVFRLVVAMQETAWIASRPAASARSTERASFFADRPFLIVIRDGRSGAVLFLGQVTTATQPATSL